MTRSRAVVALIILASARGVAFAQTPGAVAPPSMLPGPDPDALFPVVQAQLPTAAEPGAQGAPPSPAGSPPTGSAQDPAKPKLELVWNNGLFAQSTDQAFVFHVGGTLHYDGAWYSAGQSVQNFPGGTGRFVDGVNPRRGRVRLEGTLYQAVDFQAEYEFFNGIGPATGPATANSTTFSPGPRNAWVTLKDIPLVGNVRVGNQKEPISLEHLNSYRFLEFLERSFLYDANQASAFNNGFTPGVSVFRTWADDRVFTHAGLFKNESDLLGFGLGNGQYAATGRVAALPIWQPDEGYFLHVGGSMSHRDPVGGQVRVRVRDNVRNAPNPLANLPADTGLVNAESQDLFNLETAAVLGPVTLQAEYLANAIHGASSATGTRLGSPVFNGYYAESMLFLTGERRTWNQKSATFNRVVPLQNFGFDPKTGRSTGWGAFELAARYSTLNLDDDGVRGGRLRAATLGLNWYLNPNAKLQANYDYTYRDGGSNPLARGAIHAFGTRVAFDF